MKTIFLLLLSLLMVGGCQHARSRPPRAVSAATISQVHGTVYFGFNHWKLSVDQENVVAKKAELLKQHKDASVILEGHTDSVGSQDYNLQLGDRRARNVKFELVRYGIDPSRLVVMSYGEDRPYLQGHSEEIRRQNRRVELLVK